MKLHLSLSFGRYGVAEKLGMDETAVDVTEEVHRRLFEAPTPKSIGHLHLATQQVGGR